MTKSQQQQAENHLHDTEPKWFAIYTRYKREKVVHKHLAQKGLQSYLPINKVVRRWERRVKQVELPLISCYVFVKITKAEYVKVLETENVLSFVRFSKNLISIPDAEIELMRRVTGEYGDIAISEARFRKGDMVEILCGSLTGTKGRLVEVEDKKRFILEMESLGYSLLIEVKPDTIRKVER